MKNIYLSLLILFSLSIFAQENEEAGEWAAAEYHFCDFNEGYDMDDLMRVVSKFNRFLDEYSEAGDYDAVLIQERYDVDNDWDYVWVGHWPSMEDMANGTENWFQNGGKIAAEIQKVSDCSAVRGWQYIYRFQPAESAVWPVNYRTCSLKEEYTHADVRDLYDRAAEKRTNDGFPGGGRLFYQQFGSQDHDWDTYVQVSAPGSFADEAVIAELSETVDYSAINEEWASMVDCTPYVQYVGSYLTDPLE